jgi:hypothetical protein
LVEALVEVILVLPAVRAEAVVRVMVVELVVELELLDLPDRVMMVDPAATEMVTVLLEAEVLAAAEEGVLLLVEEDKVMVQLQAQAVPACIIIIELVRIFLMLVVAEVQAVVMGQVQLLVELAVVDKGPQEQ